MYNRINIFNGQCLNHPTAPYFEFQNKTEGLDFQYMHKNFYNPGFEDKTFAGTDTTANSVIIYI